MPRPAPRLHSSALGFCLCILNTRNVNPNSCPWPLPFASHTGGTSSSSSAPFAPPPEPLRMPGNPLFHIGYYAVDVYAAAACNNLFSSFPHLARCWKNSKHCIYHFHTHPAAESARFFLEEETNRKEKPKAKPNGSCWHFMLAAMPFPCIPQLAII